MLRPPCCLPPHPPIVVAVAHVTVHAVNLPGCQLFAFAPSMGACCAMPSIAIGGRLRLDVAQALLLEGAA
eukprot:1711837-Prorocentrum_lima.AAC.1